MKRLTVCPRLDSKLSTGSGCIGYHYDANVYLTNIVVIYPGCNGDLVRAAAQKSEGPLIAAAQIVRTP